MPPPNALPAPSRREQAQRSRRRRERISGVPYTPETVQSSPVRRRRFSSNRSSNHVSHNDRVSVSTSNRQRGQRRRRDRERAAFRVNSADPVARRRYVEPIYPVNFGSLSVICSHCKAFHWLSERVKQSSTSSPLFSHCCHHGKVDLDLLPDPPDSLLHLFTSSATDARQFRENIRRYNCALAFTSFTTNHKDDVNAGGGGPWIWKSGYALYHHAGSLFPERHNDPTYAQLYYYDPQDALDFRMNNNIGLSRTTMETLQQVLLEKHRYNVVFQHCFEVLQNNPANDLHIRLLADSSTDLRRYNAPTVDEIAVVVPGNEARPVNARDIILHRRDGDLQFINDHHHAYAPLHYVLLFPHGTPGWTYGLQQRNPVIVDDTDDSNTTEPDPSSKSLTQIMFYSFRLHTHDGEFPLLHSGGRLFQQYICDIWVSTDQNRLRWIASHQPQLRAALYSGLEDAASAADPDPDLKEIGHRVVLPSSFVGSPRYMNQRFQDAIALARYYHGFDLFITFTCNPSWPEIIDSLLPGQVTADRPDLSTRVFNMYKTALLDDLTKHHVLGPLLGYVYTIEFQKRGLPHMHLLLTLSPDFRPNSPEEVDTLIRATWPDPISEPRLFAIVKKNMVHGPCGQWNTNAPCMKDGRCSKGFPKAFQSETAMSGSGYPIYARPDDGRSFEVRNFPADNRWIVPYNPHLLSRFDAHMNVESVISLAAAKYITKYTHKGPDRSTVELRLRDEVSEYKDCRYVAASEASWRLFELPIHHQEPAVVSLQIHLPGQHSVVFNADESIDVVRARIDEERSMLTAFFSLNRHDPSAHRYTYQELPQFFVWDHGHKQWKRRRRGSCIGRIYFVSPTAGERFYLRTLLITVKGPTSWEHLRSFEGVVHPSFHAACLARGLLENDDEWRQCLTEASISHVGQSLRRLFCLILKHCVPSQPDILWFEFRSNLCDDLQRRMKLLTNSTTDVPIDDVYDYGLFLLDLELRQNGSSLSSFPSMPRAVKNWERNEGNSYIAEQLDYQTDDEQRQFDLNFSVLNSDQKTAFDAVFSSVYAQNGLLFFLHGPAGTGKTFLYHTLCHRCRANGWVVLCVASSGIASLLLPGGHTAHSTFSIPVENLDDQSFCQINKNSPQADMLRIVRLIIWDEAVTQHRHAIEAVDRLFQDMFSTTRSFGGVTVVFGGDFQQTLPVVVHGNRADVVHATIQASELWSHVQVLHLRQNMRLLPTNDSENFARWLIEVGHALESQPLSSKSSIALPSQMCCYDEHTLIETVYNSLSTVGSLPAPEYFRDRAILAPRNDDVRALNETILNLLPGEERSFQSADSYSIESPCQIQNQDIPLEFLHTLNASGLPIANLRLKIGCPIIILRNIDTKRGLCNGTRATILHMSNRLLEVKLLNGDHAGESALIPRITLSPNLTGHDSVVKLNRRQFPVQLALAMTVNKAQGQTVQRIGIDLRKSVFAHGQLYVALTRVTSSTNVSVLLSPLTPNETLNVVYPEILLD